MLKKQCAGDCGKYLPVTSKHFYRRKGSLDGLQHICIKCMKQYNKSYINTNFIKANNVKSLRLSNNVSQGELAIILGVNRRTIIRLENRETGVNNKREKQLVEYFGVNRELLYAE